MLRFAFTFIALSSLFSHIVLAEDGVHAQVETVPVKDVRVKIVCASGVPNNDEQYDVNVANRVISNLNKAVAEYNDSLISTSIPTKVGVLTCVTVTYKSTKVTVILET